MRRFLLVTLLTLVAGAAVAVPAWAGSPHFVGTPTITRVGDAHVRGCGLIDPVLRRDRHRRGRARARRDQERRDGARREAGHEPRSPRAAHSMVRQTVRFLLMLLIQLPRASLMPT